VKKLTVRLRRSPTDSIDVGQLADVDGRILFEYAPDFLDTGLELSPFKWPRRLGLIEHTDLAFGPLPGWIDDSLPDGWGLLLMDRLFRKRGIDPATVSPLDRLAWLGTRTMGALTYHPPADVERDDAVIDLHALGKNAERVYRGESVEILPELMRAGGSPGGARPKVIVGVRGDTLVSGEDDLPRGYQHWIVKFSAKADVPDIGPMELAYAAMARAAGIDMPHTRLFHVAKRKSYFAVQRFDRGPGNTRAHTHTFANLVHANFRAPSTDYVDLLKVTHALTRNHRDLLRVFRQMAFNVAAHNRDDHAKNFAFVMDRRGEWSLSPAYDLIFATGPGGEHTMAVAGEGRAPSRQDVMRAARAVGIATREADPILEQVNEALARWKSFATDAGCTGKTALLIQRHHRPL
jgi:serine/threonine-protein kinase HipA